MRPLATASLLLLILTSHAGLALDEGRGRVDLAVDGIDLPTPESYLGYPLGDRFTAQHRVFAYLDALAAASSRIETWQYGETYEGRPLKLLALTSAKNLERLEDIRQAHLRLSRGEVSPKEAEDLLRDAPAIIWLAYGIHGNESSSTEVAMAVAYALAAAEGEEARLLDQVVVLIDPLVNPDGRERYVQGFQQRRGRLPDSSRFSLEHDEPWPGGRFNHYLNDLNRDWAWATQAETRARLAAYRRWEPVVYADFHEMGSDSTYFFPPAADPILPTIDPRTVAWLEVFGRGNAEEFDRRGWPYYKGENFDLFYPGYGDSYPALRAAVGMTYEVAGGGLGGLLVEQKQGTFLTLSDRIAQHFATSMSTVQVAAENRRQLLEEFVDVRRDLVEGPPVSFLWEQRPGEASAMEELLQLHGIEVSRLPRDSNLRARPITGGDAEERPFTAGSYVVDTAQPLGGLARTLLEAEAAMPASFVSEQRRRLEQDRPTEFYDVTAWSLPLAFGVETWIVEGRLPGRGESAAEAGASPPAEIPGNALGVLVPPRGLGGYRFAADLQEAGLRYRLALRAFTFQGRELPAGTLFIPRAGNPPELGSWLEEHLAEGTEALPVTSSFETSRLSLGSDDFIAVRSPRIALAGGEGVSATGHGSLWFLLDRLVERSSSRIGLDVLGSADLDEVDVLVLPAGRGYDDAVDDDAVDNLKRWVRAGGFLLAVGEAVDWLESRDLSQVRPWRVQEENLEPGDGETDEEPWSLETAPISTPGAAVATVLSDGHPLALGLERSPAVLVTGSRIFRPTGNPRKDLLVARQIEPVVAGFVWPEAEARLAGSLLVGVETLGDGAILTFAHDPAFRLFWRATMPIALNGILHGPSLLDAGSL